jgi:hypothetical protein
MLPAQTKSAFCSKRLIAYSKRGVGTAFSETQSGCSPSQLRGGQKWQLWDGRRSISRRLNGGSQQAKTKQSGIIPFRSDRSLSVS